MSQVSFLPPYNSTRTAMRVLGVLLILTAAVSWISVGVDWALLHLAGEVRAGTPVTRADRLAHLRLAGTLNSIQLVFTLATGGAFLAWLYQSRINVRALGARKLRWRREWTVLAFLIPGLNVLRPYQVAREVWQASDPSTTDPMGWQDIQVSPLLRGWWITFLIFVGFELMAWTILIGIDTAGERRLAYTLRALADTSAAISASLAYFVAARITDAQERKHALYDGRPETLALDPRDALAS